MHATQHGFCDPRQNHHTKKSKSQKLSPFPRNASNPYYWEKNKKNKAVLEILKVKAARVAKAGEKNGGKKQNGGRKFERFTPRFEKQVPVTTFSPRRWPKQRVAVESDSEFEFGKNCEFKLLKPLAAAFDDELVESDAEFHSWSDEPQRRSSEEAAVRRQDRTRFKADAAADPDCYQNQYCECCWPRSLRSPSVMGSGAWGGAGGQGPGRTQLGCPSLG